MTTDALRRAGARRRIDTLVGVGLRLARTAPTGRCVLAHLARTIDLAWIPRPWGEEIVCERP